MQKNGAWFQTYFGQAILGDQKVTQENVKSYFYWGLHTQKVKDIAQPNSGGLTDFNPLVKSLTKYLKNKKPKFPEVNDGCWNCHEVASVYLSDKLDVYFEMLQFPFPKNYHFPLLPPSSSVVAFLCPPN